jgi:ribose transport system substrate-binding protein
MTPIPPRPPVITKAKTDGLLEQIDSHGVSRRQFVKVLGSTLAATSMGAALAACGSSSQAATGGSAAAASDGKVAIINFSLVGDYSVEWNQGAIAAAKQLGLKQASFNGNADASTQQNEFEQAITQGTNAIFTLPVDGGLVPTLARQANQEKVFFASAWSTQAWFTPWDSGEYYTEFLIDDEIPAVAATTEVLAKAIGGEGTVVRVGGFPNDSTELLRLAGFKQGLANYPKIKFAAQLYGQYAPQPSEQAAASLLSKYPDTVGISAVNDDAATGVIAAIRAAGKVPGKDIFVIGTNGSVQGIKNVRDGIQLASTGNVPAYPSYQITANFYDHLRGWRPQPAERQFGWKAEILTKENVGPYYDRYVAGPIDKQFSAKLLSRTLSPKTWDWQFEAYPIEDLDSLFVSQPKPAGYQYPAAYLKAKADGSFDQIAQLWKEHYKIPVLGPGPFAA